MGKHFEWSLDNRTGAFQSRRKQNLIEAEARLDGICRSPRSCGTRLGDAETVQGYKSLARAERAFRSMKSLLRPRPLFHWKARRVLAY